MKWALEEEVLVTLIKYLDLCFRNGTPSSLTSFARSKNGVVTVGDDGKLVVISLDNPTPLSSVGKI